MTFHTPTSNQGQIVEVSYACNEGYVIRCTLDQSDRTTIYDISKCLNNDDGDYWNRAPANQRWKRMSDVDVSRWLEQPKKEVAK